MPKQIRRSNRTVKHYLKTPDLETTSTNQLQLLGTCHAQQRSSPAATRGQFKVIFVLFLVFEILHSQMVSVLTPDLPSTISQSPISWFLLCLDPSLILLVVAQGFSCLWKYTAEKRQGMTLKRNPG